MSKRHQSSRRKTYGRRQHEVRERQRSRPARRGLRVRARRVGHGRSGRSARVPRSAQPAHPLRARRLTMAVYEGARPRTIALPRRPPRPPSARPSERRRVRGAVRAGRRTNRLGIVLGRASSSRSCSRSSRSPSRSACRPPAGHRPAGARAPAARDRGRRAPLGPEPARPRAGHPQAGHRRRARPAVRAARPAGPLGDRATDAGPDRFAPPLLLLLRRLRASRRSRSSPGWPTGRSSTASGWPRRPLAQTTVTLEVPSKRGDIFDRTGTVVLATTVQRDGSSRRPTQLTPEQRRQTVATLTAILGLDPAAATTLRDTLTRQREVRHPRHGLDRVVADQVRAAIARRQRDHGPVARAGAGAGLPAAGRRAGLEPRRAPARLRQPRRRRPVRRRAGLPGDARRPAADPRRRARCQRAGAIPDDATVVEPATPGADLR